jgi:hypothetical protein
MNKIVIFTIALFYSCSVLKKDSNKVVDMKFNEPSTIYVYDGELLIYLREENLVSCLKSRKSLNTYEELLLNKIIDADEDTLRILKPENNLNLDDDNQAGIFNCLGDMLASGAAGIYNKQTSKFEESIRINTVKTPYAGHQRQFVLGSNIFLTQVFTFGE